MTQQEFVKKEANIAYPLPDKEYNVVYKCGLTKGLEIAKEFGEWIGFNYNQESDGWYFMFGDDTKTYTTDELLTIFLTEKYGQ